MLKIWPELYSVAPIKGLYSALRLLILNQNLFNSYRRQLDISSVNLSTSFKLLNRARRHSNPEFFNKSHLRNEVVYDTDVYNSCTFFKLFKPYLVLNTVFYTFRYEVHASFAFFFLRHVAGGTSVVSIRKLFVRWKDAYLLFFNLFFYKIDLLVFGTSVFKNELLGLNWDVFSRLRVSWRYTKPFLFHRPNKIDRLGDWLFARIRIFGINSAFVLDIFYHKKTIHYLHRAGFYTIGAVPTTSDIKSVNFALPTSLDSGLTQLFFLRFTLVVKKQASGFFFNKVYSSWLSFLKFLV
jgi:hypothetical protein